MSKKDRSVNKIVVRNRRRKIIRTITGICCVTAIALMMFFAGLKASAITTGAKGLDTGNYSKMYKSVMVERDDCIWDIADRYMGVGYNDTKEYVAEIIDLNNLSGTEIHYGDYICVPYYG